MGRELQQDGSDLLVHRIVCWATIYIIIEFSFPNQIGFSKPSRSHFMFGLLLSLTLY